MIDTMSLNKQLANMVRRDAENDYVASKEMWHDDEEMMEMVNNDYKNLQEYADLVEQGEFKAAYNRSYDMDTANRENIPDSVYYYVLDVVSE
jgi:hypothetical protein